VHSYKKYIAYEFIRFVFPPIIVSQTFDLGEGV